ncbi:putative repeat protein (TIGR02543 family) [Breznakia sp. PF5-3]|uniref:InlB B-repeat-containing protein n=1 Tax=unclassified Breznakia TaxID=2623764 RepID=UPI0024061773|nr:MULTISPECIES: InlB B-repeat-containing protein [unclassified Breznakia]MDF9825595.1 putative repeat protein (TIGR02543 family) [Breznakia sp. PM6-1]MDF9835850.1 putative repeat protein (TIGR02543 family) [Breznakia sp. PF5-3]MDF9837595.1 putative repeat protein (TIGR02543 family) [Breznakia sp. PFB2-8]MDF9860024.1 putative repeat protein (TIGR02543 family) [Breznakia sp. PH5-24]
MKKSIKAFIALLVLFVGLIPIQKMIVNAEVLEEKLSIIAEDVSVNQFDETFNLLDGVSAVDENGEAVDVSIKDDGGFDVSVENTYTITYEAIHPVDGDVVTKERVVTVKEETKGAQGEPSVGAAKSLAKAPRISQTVSNVSELQSALSTAAEGDVYTLASGFVSGPITITMPNVNVTIDGNGCVWNAGSINVNGAGTGSLTIKNLTVDGTSISSRLLSTTHTAGTLTLEEMTFQNATAGAIDVTTFAPATTVINKTSIKNNTSVNSASAVLLAKEAKVTINYSTIENNSATGAGYECGAIASKQHSGTLDVNNTVFRNNVNNCVKSGPFGGGGGAMSFHYLQGQVTINESYFYGNKTSGTASSTENTYDGGAIYVIDGKDGATFTIDKTTFDSNIATDDGGAIMFQGTGKPGFATTITNSTFYNNHAYGLDGGDVSGGAIQYYRNGFTGTTFTNTITGCTFVGNVSGNENSTIDQKGGALGMSGSSVGASATRNDSLFIGNQVYGSTGVINTASTYKDISNYSTVQTNNNLVNVDKGATPANTIEDVLGKNNVMLTANYSSIKAGVEAMVVPTIPIKPEGLAENKTSSELSGGDQRTFNRFKDIGAVESTFVKYDANGGDFTLSPLTAYDGTKYYEVDASNKTTTYYDVGYIGLDGTIKSGTALSAAHPTRVFLGWSTDPSATAADTTYDPGTAVTHAKENLTLYAVWGLATTYNVTYDVNTGTGTAPVDNIDYVSGGQVVVKGPGSISKEGYEFVGWNTEANGSGVSYTENGTFNITKDTILYAQWSELYTVTFDSQGGSSVSSQTGLRVGDFVSEPSAPTRAGYTFKGWHHESGCTTVWEFDTHTINGHKTLYAKWEKNADPVKPSPKPSEKPKDIVKPSTDPATGDTTNTNALLALIGLSGIAILAGLAKKYKFNK